MVAAHRLHLPPLLNSQESCWLSVASSSNLALGWEATHMELLLVCNSKDNTYDREGWKLSSHNGPQHPAQGGMTTQPSVVRFTEQGKAASTMFAKKTASPTLVPPKDFVF